MSPALDIVGISLDSRTVVPGEIFVAIVGEQFDGHDYVEQAMARGACLVLLEHRVSVQCPAIVVNSTIDALAQLTYFLRQRWDGIVVAVTGSSGKTTTKGMIQSLLGLKGPVFASLKSYNNQIGVPLTMFGIALKHWAGIFEVGTNHPGEIRALVSQIPTDVAVLLNTGSAHIEAFGSEAAIAEEKFQIFSHLKPNGVAILPYASVYRDQWISELRQREVQILTFGEDLGKDVKPDCYARSIVDQIGEPLRFKLYYQGQSCSIEVPLLGRHQVMNALAAAAVAIALGISVGDLPAGFAQVVASPHRMMRLQSPFVSELIDDAYNANPGSVEVALKYLASRPGFKIIVFGDMRELGDFSESAHLQVGQTAKHLGINEMLTLGTHARLAAQAFGPGAHAFADQPTLINTLKERLLVLRRQHKVGVVLVKGSNGMRMWEVAEALVNA
jgi:UDP-N-acetylmuramoyl-tripeptide--D-alanyl-D-alanine ligase